MNDETGKFTVEEVDAAPAKPERPQVDPRADRRPDYLEGFLTQKAEALTGNEPGAELYEAVIPALKEIYDPEIPVNIYGLGLIYGIDIDDDRSDGRRLGKDWDSTCRDWRLTDL